MTLRVLVIVTLAVALVEAAPAHADGSGPLAEAHAYQDELEFDLAIEAADRALLVPDTTTADKIDALTIKGSALVVLGRTGDAVIAFERIFALDPDLDLPDGTSPTILAVFRPARAAWQVKVEADLASTLGSDLAALSLGVRLPPRARGGRPISIVLDLVDPKHLGSTVLVGYRRHGGTSYSTLQGRAMAGEITFTIPGDLTVSKTDDHMEVYAQVRHVSGAVLRRQGSPEAPLTFALLAGSVPVDRPITKRWWFWTGIAALATSAVVIPLLIDSSREVGPPTVVVHGAR